MSPITLKRSEGEARETLFVLWSLVGVMVLGCLLQLRSPLRLNGDAIQLLGMAANAAEGSPTSAWSERTHYSGGYPFLVSILVRIGVATPAGLIGLNLVVLFAGLFAWARSLERMYPEHATLAPSVLLMSLSSWVVIKHLTLPMADTVFLGLTLLSLACLEPVGWSASSRYTFRLALGTVLAILAFLVRSAGIALFPAVLAAVWAILKRKDGGKIDWRRRTREVAVAAGTLIALAAATSFEFHRGTSYPSVWKEHAQSVSARDVSSLAIAKAVETGSALCNVPSRLIPANGNVVLIVMGLAIMACLAWTVFQTNPLSNPSSVFLAAYASMILVWPWIDTRFWIPAIPVAVGLAIPRVSRIGRTSGAMRVISKFVAAGWLGVGILSLGYSTRISWAGPRFADLYGDGHLRETYRAFFRGEGSGAGVDEKALSVLRRFAGRRGSKHGIDVSTASFMSDSRSAPAASNLRDGGMFSRARDPLRVLPAGLH